MATKPGWFGLWFADGYFPSVWFAPGDDTHLTPDERRAEHVGGGFIAPPAAPRRNQGKTRRDPKRDEALRIARRQRDEDILLLLI